MDNNCGFVIPAHLLASNELDLSTLLQVSKSSRTSGESKAPIEVSKLPVGVFYPPPKSNNIIEIIPSLMETDVYYLLVQGGSIFRHRLENNTGIVMD